MHDRKQLDAQWKSSVGTTVWLPPFLPPSSPQRCRGRQRWRLGWTPDPALGDLGCPALFGLPHPLWPQLFIPSVSEFALLCLKVGLYVVPDSPTPLLLPVFSCSGGCM
jgi:hypothetical protein